MKKSYFLLIIGLFLSLNLSAQFFEEKEEIKTFSDGFYEFYFDEKENKIYLNVDRLDQDFLYVSALSQGLGSNDIGLDRGQLGGEALVSFKKFGNRILLVQQNTEYIAKTNNTAEKTSVEEAFAKSVLFGFDIVKEVEGKYLIDVTSFLIRDEHGVSSLLKAQGQGSYSLDKTKSALNLSKTKSFPKNVIFDVLLTFKGQATGGQVRSISPDSRLLTVGQQHSFVELPELGFETRAFDPRSGSFFMEYMDYASAVDQPIVKQLIVKHRLRKKNPELERSEAVEPIIYYLDPGTPEPVRSALMEGASWWNQAFESLGYIDAFQVKILPEGADLLDVRYNVIQWVHRSTRGWSYGASVKDPRTGEIIKGHVSLGSLRIRQDYLIAKSLLGSDSQADQKAMELALARIRQLAAHEVGHTLGFAHNFAASSNDRSSVMDYPHPKVSIDKNGNLDLSKAYEVGIGSWDKIATQYAYQDFTENSKEQLKSILDRATEQGFRFISDSDARSMGGAHAYAHLWDNGNDMLSGMQEVFEVREYAINNFSDDIISDGMSYTSLEDAFVPIYFYHRYQLEALSKLVGGMDYSYSVKGGLEEKFSYLEAEIQREALEAILVSLSPEFLMIPDRVLSNFPPRSYGQPRSRESFKSFSGVSFDALAAAETSADFSLKFLMHPERLNRIIEQSSFDDNQLNLQNLFDELLNNTILAQSMEGRLGAVQNSVNFVVMDHIYYLAINSSSPEIKAYAYQSINQVNKYLLKQKAKGVRGVYDKQILRDIELVLNNPEKYKFNKIAKMPDGSPI
jgi:hypothetical protein